MAAENALLLKEVFGESSESGDDFEHRSEIENVISETSEHSHNWEQIKEIKGLWLCRDFLSPKKQAYLLSAIRNEGWLIKSSHNQAMKFGDLPAWAVELSDSIREAVLSSNYVMDPLNLESFNGDEEGCLLPSNLLWREPFFDQLIANSYQPGYLCTRRSHAI